MTDHILTLNAGSSSIKFSLFAAREASGDVRERVRGQVEGLGHSPRIKANDDGGETILDEPLAAESGASHASALKAILDFLDERFPDAEVVAVGHRVVHGGPEIAWPVRLDAETMETLRKYEPLAPLHQPHNLAGIEAAQEGFPKAVQIACFDTAFHRKHPWVNDTFALPRSLYDEGVRRYGFHGLSYEYVTQRLTEISPHFAAGRVVVAHLGNGASMCAIRDGQSIGSTMGFTALDGLPMGTRCGQLDPGVVLYLLQQKEMTPKEIETLLYTESGLKGLSGVSHDMRALEQAGTPEAQQAIDYFVFRIRRELGAMTSVLNGLDAVVFTGGIGENAVTVRERVTEGFEWLGMELDRARNRAGETVISAERSRVRAFVIRTNEELMIARQCRRLLDET